MGLAEDIKKLRSETGAGVMDCKNSLEETGGDYSKAKELIREKGLAKGEKRAGRETGAGLVHSYIHGGRIGVLLELRAETDFVVKSDPFQKLAEELAMQIAASNPEDISELLDQPYIRDESRRIDDLVKEVIGKVGENINIGKFYRIEV